jgi:hypothetical protein
MPGLIGKPHGEDLDFELFSNIVLKFTAILMVVLVLLAINTGQKLDQIISPYRFSGGSARPQLYVTAYETPDGRNNAKTTVALFSPSFAQAATRVDPKTGETIPSQNEVTFGGRFYARPYFAMSLLAGVSQDALVINGQKTPFIVPNFDKKTYGYVDKAGKRRVTAASEPIARNFLKLWSDVYSNPVYPTRAFSEYRNTIVRIYVETCVENGRHGFAIGDRTITAARIKSGDIDFLTGLSSTNTEIVYLGDCAGDASAQIQNRLEFYKANGFTDAANHLGSPKADEAANALLEDGMLTNVKPDVYGLPSILAYPDAWRAFVEYRLKSAPTPPEWFIREFLQPLGFDKRVMQIEAGAK